MNVGVSNGKMRVTQISVFCESKFSKKKRMKRGRRLQYRKYNELTLALFFTLGPSDIQPHLGMTQHTYDICGYTHTNIVIEPVIQREFRVLGKSISLKT